MSVGQELLDVPLPDMVTKLALGIAEAQKALDENSVETAKELAETEIDVVPAITQTIKDDGVEYKNASTISMSLLQVGLNPTFYQFSEASIEVSMDIKTTTSTETSIKVGAKAQAGFGCWSASIQVDVAHNRKFQKEVHGTSRLAVKLTPVPPPPRIYPQILVVDTRKPPTPSPGPQP
jgi:hypothetical protein